MLSVFSDHLLPPPETPLTQLHHSLLHARKLRLLLKRDDLLHPLIGGNKWRKLRYNLLQAKQENRTLLVTFGGAYSNHIAAVAAAGKAFGFDTVGFIRGEEHTPLNPTLQQATQSGMALHYLSRELYRRKTEPEVLQPLLAPFGRQAYLIPEGGSNALAVKGCAELVAELNVPWNYLCCPAGTGASLAGLIAGANGAGQVLGFAALKGAGFLTADVARLLANATGKTYHNWRLFTEYHFGGYAKITPELTTFMQAFEQEQGITLDPVYTAKMMFGIFDLIGQGYFAEGSTIVAWHTGGLQGIAGMRERALLA